jgi:drug/metabolite transporter (DMT)-like permease
VWILLALTCAVLVGTSDALSKRLLAHSEERIVAWGKLAWAIPWLAPGFLLAGWPRLNGLFWWLMIVMVPLELTAYLCSLRAIRTTPLSLCIPFMAFTPLITVLTGWLFLGERVSPAGFAGVLCITAGGYVLQVDEMAYGILGPLKAMWRTPGIRLMLITAGLYGITGTIWKRLVQLAGVGVFPFLYYCLDTLALTPLAYRGAGSTAGLSRAMGAQWKIYLAAGAILAAAIVVQAVGVQMVPVAYFISVKRVSLLVSVLYGGVLFRETAFLQRVSGTLLMMAGVALIALSA